MTTLVAIPYYGVAPELIDKAVKHAVAQTADVVVLVAGDGQKPPVSVKSSRLVVGTFPTNLGAPCTQQAMILGSRFQWYAPMGSDDWIEPYHVSSLLALGTPVNGSGAIWYHEPHRTQIFRSPRTYIEFGCLDTALLRAIGGYNPAEPCGQDSVLISILVRTSRYRLTSRPSYHKLHRLDSLTHHPDTRGGSPLRTGVRQRNRDVLARLERMGWRNREAIRAFRDSLIPPSVKTQLDDRVALVEQWLR